MADIKFEIKETLGAIAESAKGWKKELNIISWNGKEAKYDLREWSPDHEKMGKRSFLAHYSGRASGMEIRYCIQPGNGVGFLCLFVFKAYASCMACAIF